MITRDLAAGLSSLLVEEAPANAVRPVMSWIQVLQHMGGQGALDTVEHEASERAAALFVGDGLVEAGVKTRVFYAKVRDLARQAQRDFESELAAARLARVKERQALIDASVPAHLRAK